MPEADGTPCTHAKGIEGTRCPMQRGKTEERVKSANMPILTLYLLVDQFSAQRMTVWLFGMPRHAMHRPIARWCGAKNERDEEGPDRLDGMFPRVQPCRKPPWLPCPSSYFVSPTPSTTLTSHARKNQELMLGCRYIVCHGEIEMWTLRFRGKKSQEQTKAMLDCLQAPTL